MGIIVDLIIVAILAGSIYKGYKRGLTGCLIKILSFFLAIIVACVLVKPVASVIINNTQIDEKIQASILENFNAEEDNNSDNNSNDETIVENEKEISAELDEAIESEEIKNSFAEPLLIYLNEQIESTTEQVKNDAIEVTAYNLSKLTINVVTFLVLFLLGSILLRFIKALTTLITKIPVIKQIDKLGGIIYGTLKGALIIFFILMLISIISPATNSYELGNLIQQSYLGSLLYNNNILLKIIF